MNGTKINSWISVLYFPWTLAYGTFLGSRGVTPPVDSRVYRSFQKSFLPHWPNIKRKQLTSCSLSCSCKILSCANTLTTLKPLFISCCFSKRTAWRASFGAFFVIASTAAFSSSITGSWLFRSRIISCRNIQITKLRSEAYRHSRRYAASSCDYPALAMHNTNNERVRVEVNIGRQCQCMSVT